MNTVISRLAVALAGLPIVLGVAWIGGWALAGVAAVASLLALHELYRITRSLRPLVLAGYGGAIAALLGLQAGGIEWLGAGFLLTVILAFVFAALADTTSSSTAAVAVTVFGVLWIVGGLAHLLLIREFAVDPGGGSRGELAIFTVLIAVFVTDTAAYAVGRLVGRRKLVPGSHPARPGKGLSAARSAASSRPG